MQKKLIRVGAVIGMAIIGVIIHSQFKAGHFNPPPKEFEGLTVPLGFSIEPYVLDSNIEQPTSITFGPDGNLYILTLWGELFTVDVNNRRAPLKARRAFFPFPDQKILYATGIAFHNDELFVSDSGRISRFADSNYDYEYDSVIPIVTELPSLLYTVHSNNGIAFGPDGKLYAGIGSTTDHGPIRYPLEAAILRMNPDGSELEVYATGFRNPYDIAFSPDGKMFAPDNNPDGLDGEFPEELNLIQANQYYGFPEDFTLSEVPPDLNVIQPLVELPASTASSGLVYYHDDAFPDEYQDGLFLAQWGSADETVAQFNIDNGRAVVFIKLESLPNEELTASWTYFVTQEETAVERWRPIDIAISSDGDLYIAEFSRGIIYRVRWDGE